MVLPRACCPEEKIKGLGYIQQQDSEVVMIHYVLRLHSKLPDVFFFNFLKIVPFLFFSLICIFVFLKSYLF